MMSRKIIISDVDLMSEDEERKLVQSLQDQNIGFEMWESIEVE